MACEEQSQFRPKHLFHFCNTWDTKLLYFVGTAAAIFQGVCMPCLSIFFGAILSETADSGGTTDSNSTTIVAGRRTTSTGNSSTLNLFLFVSVGMFLSGFVNNICFNIGADRQVFAFRQSYLRNVLFWICGIMTYWTYTEYRLQLDNTRTR